ncbi:unnamed protein product [Clonostachys rosea]|uniref:Heterokaryon incompatibility domain-containing protein n=1 Tax=Bionectria ochroleuca TaxID=29856 RepID=A0ABY6UJB1_BIOOC|nr:unnamed protein product [Clonostachys rosea]
MPAPTQGQQQPAPNTPDEDCGHLHYPHPANGSLIPLAVQSLRYGSEISESQPWANLGMPASRVPTLQAAWYWILSPVLVEGSEDRRLTPGSASLVFLRLVVVAPFTSVMLPSWTNGVPALISWNHTQQAALDANSSKYDLFYDRLPTALSHSSSVEESLSTAATFSANIQLGGQQVQSENPDSPIVRHPTTFQARSQPGGLSLRPRYLCFLTGSEEKPYRTISVSDYVHEHGDQADTEFIFVSYTRMQFRVATDEEINTYGYPDEETREANRKLAKSDRETLARWGVDAAKAAGKPAFWLDFECVRDSDGVARSSSKSEDVYRICDIVRAAHSMIIAIGPSAEDKVSNLLRGDDSGSSDAFNTEHSSQWLRQWGSRLWTLPELLLCPNEYRIKLYVFGDSREPKELAKRNFAERAWEDAESVKELVNHYEASAILTSRQLIEIALECFARRKTDQFSAGDVAYAIMGLFPDSQRPQIDQNDSGFRAFARLALAIDDGNILARMMCLGPLNASSPWSDTSDYWGSRLRDFRPAGHVVDVTSSDALVIQDVFATPITWDKIERSTSLKYLGEGFRVPLILAFNIAWMCLPIWLWVTWIIPYSENSMFLFAILIYAAAAVLVVCSILFPFTFMFFGIPYSGTKEKSRIIGIQGAVDTATVERYIWGFNHGRLKETVADDEQSESLGTFRKEPAGQIFTIVDTTTLTMTVVRCTAPPVAIVVCGQAGGTDRALLCSFDCKTGSYHREKVLRVDPLMSSLMHRTRSMHLCLTPLGPSLAPTTASETDDENGGHGIGIVSSINESAKLASKPWSLSFRFLLIMVTATQIFSPRSYFSSDLYSGIAYFAGFVLAQIAAFVSFRKGTLLQIIAPALYSSAWFKLTFRIRDYRDVVLLTENSQKILESSTVLLRGAAIGTTITGLVFYHWAWFSKKKAIWQTLAWAVLTSEIFRVVSVFVRLWDPWERIKVSHLLDVTISGMILALATIYSLYLSLPQDSPWLDVTGRMAVISSSSISRYNTEETPKWLKTSVSRLRRHHLLQLTNRSMQGSSWPIVVLYSTLITLIAFISGTMFLNVPQHALYDIPELLPGSAVVVVAVLANWLLPYHLPALLCKLRSPRFCFQKPGTNVSGRSGDAFVLRCWDFLHVSNHVPFLVIWIIILDEMDTLTQAFGLLCLSITAWGAGGFLSTTPISLDKIKVLGIPVFATIQTFLVVLAGTLAIARKRRDISAQRTRAVQSQYQDVDEDLA